MDDIFDNLIYIIIMVVIFIISAIGKNKKKQAQRASVTDGDNMEKKASPFSFSNIEKLIKEEMGIEDQNIYNDPYENEVILEEETGVGNLDTIPNENLDSKKDKAYSSIEYEDTRKVFSDFIESPDLSNEESLEESILDDFNLQDAVIYSEIINRKEY